MSILATQTNFFLHNTTSKFLEITIGAEQDEEFRLMPHQSSNVVPMTNNSNNNNTSFVSWVMESLLNTFTGNKLQQIKINLPGKSKVPMTIRCTSTLTFQTKIKSTDCTDMIAGDFDLNPEYHGETMTIQWEPILGYGYDKSGNVAIGGKMPSRRDMAINCKFKNGKNETIRGIDVTPACCKVTFS